MAQVAAYRAAVRAAPGDEARVYEEAYAGFRRRSERRRATDGAWQKAHPARHRAKSAAWTASHPEQVRAKIRAYRAAYPEKAQAIKARRRARKAGAIGRHTVEEWLELCAASEWACVYCGAIGPLTRDHVVALAAGGSDDIENIAPACQSCNSSKHSKSLEDWRRALAELTGSNSA